MSWMSGASVVVWVTSLSSTVVFCRKEPECFCYISTFRSFWPHCDSFIPGQSWVHCHSSVRTKFVALISIPFQTCSSHDIWISMNAWNGTNGYPYLHPSVNDNREKADREYVEELEKLKQPHDEGGKGSVHFRPSYPGDCLWECRPVILNPWYQWVVLKCWNRSDSGVWLFWLGSINWKCLLVIHILFWQSACTSCDRISTQIRIKLGF